MMYYPWNTENVARLTKLWGEGFSAGLIADEMQGGLTRCSVIGKVHRLGLIRPYGPVHSKRLPAQGRRRKYYPKPREQRPPRFTERPAPPPPRITEPVSRGLSILELTDSTCKYPYGDRPPFTFCGATSMDDSPYCSWHSARCFNGLPVKRAAN